MYREEILEHWQNPQNFGVIDNADLVIEQVNPLCGDEVTFYFRFTRGPVSNFPPVSAQSKSKSKSSNKSNHDLRAAGNPSIAVIPRNGQMANGEWLIADVKFSGSGCAISIATASILSENIKNKKISALSKITGQDVLKLIGGEVAPARLKCAFLALEAVRKINNH